VNHRVRNRRIYVLTPGFAVWLVSIPNLPNSYSKQDSNHGETNEQEHHQTFNSRRSCSRRRISINHRDERARSRTSANGAADWNKYRTNRCSTRN
jgi:hypothetical protein